MIAVVDYHKGNLMSVERGLAGVGADAHITDDVEVIGEADAIVLPGVGAFVDAMGSMNELGQSEVIVERVAAGVPFLGICLGLHLLYAAGEEHAEDNP
ncbi:MAG: imidazole glycerol phosphate synthase subunit HisH, partial [Eggerthellaceae bacterium]|nr:imidazole glycerol phosphate synthase subunit HisH [Eggerthellaceae bacterium]